MYRRLLGKNDAGRPLERKPTAPVLALDKAQAHYRTGRGTFRPILSGIDLVVQRGESIGILGASGSGKSTLLSLLGLLKHPSGGDVVMHGVSLRAAKDDQLSRLRNSHIGFIFQDYSLIPHLTVMENLLVPMQYGTPIRPYLARQLANKQLDAVGLGGHGTRRPMSLSGGEQQRVAIARSLMRSPSLLLADEPTGALDEDTAELVMSHLVSATQTSDTALIVVTHNKRIAQTMSRQYRLVDGALKDITQ